MKFTILWTQVTLNQLAAIWMRADDRNAVTDAVTNIDERLKEDTENEGEARDDSERILFESPLGVQFVVEPDDARVTVTAVWSISKRRPPS